MIKFFSKFSRITVMALIAGIYALLGKLGLSLAFVNISATAVWPPSGFALAVILLLGNRVWPAIFLGALAINLSTTGNVPSSIGIATGNTLEAIVAAFFVQRFAGGVRAFNRVQDIFKFVLLAALVSTAVSATIGVFSLLLSGLAQWNQVKSIWVTWWFGDMVSNLIVAPMLVLWATRPVPLTRARIKALALLLVPLIFVGLIVFGNWHSAKLANSPLIFLELPLFLWIGLRFSQRITVTAAFLTCAIAIWGTLHGGGPLANGDPNTSLVFLQLFMGILTLSALMMSAVVHERRHTEENRSELLNLAQKLNTATSPKRAGEIITEAAANLFGWDACFIHLVNEKKELLFPIINIDTIKGEKTAVASTYHGGPPSPFLREVLEQGAKLLLRKPPFEFRSGAIAFGDITRPSASLMFVPIRDAQKVVGIFSVQSYTPNAYDNNNLTALQSLADYCGGALERIRVTEDLRKAKEELAQRADDLETRVDERTAALNETISSLESFCYTIAHDLRAPLRSVQGFARFLVEDYGNKLDSAGQDYCRRISTSANNMDNLIRDLLLYGQLAHRDLPLESVALERLTNDILGDLAEEITLKNAEVEVKRPLPTVVGNTTVIEQALNNLITNALKFSIANTRPRISIWAEPVNGKVRLWIEDNGIGIAAEHQERIFEVFQRLHDNVAFPGTGIGLAIVRKGIERIGGRVGVESQVGQGSKFWIELAQAK